MENYIALFRGINVGGNHSLKMQDLRELLEGLGATGVKTYIQSGNVLLQHKSGKPSELSARITAAIKESHGFAPKVLLLKLAQLQAAAHNNPFAEAEAEPKSLHVYFLGKEASAPRLDILEQCKKDSERYRLDGRFFYLHAPDGIGRSKLAERVEKALGVSTTARNWRTVCKLLEMAEE